MLEVDKIDVWYGVTQVLRSVSFAVPANSIVALLGGNGSGKTTVVNAVSGMVSPRSGAVRLLGKTLPAPARITSSRPAWFKCRKGARYSRP